MKKEFRVVTNGSVQITTADERWYSRQGVHPDTGLPEMQFVPSVTWIAGHYPKGIGFYKWLADKGWDESQAIKEAAGDKGSRVHRAIVDLLDGGTVPMDAKYAVGEELAQELSLEEYDCLRAFADFWVACQPETLAREVTVFNAEHGYAGTVDWMGRLRKPPKGVAAGGIWLLDWKTGQYVWPEHELQVSAYAHADDVSADHLGILQVGYRKNKAGWKLTPVKDQFPLFLAAKQIWAKECEGQSPSKKDYPLSLSLGMAGAVRGGGEAHA